MRYLISGTTSGIGKAIKQKLDPKMIYELNRNEIDLDEPALVKQIKLPKVDCAILNAGHDLGGGVPFVEHDEARILKILNCNLVSNVLLAHKLLNNNPDTIIIFVTSTNVNKQYPNNLVYNLTKLGIKNLHDLIKIDHPGAKVKEARIGLTKTQFNDNRHKENHKAINDLYVNKHLTPDIVAERVLDLVVSDKTMSEINAE